MADGQVARQLFQDLGVEDLGHQAQAPVLAHPAAVPGDVPQDSWPRCCRA